MKFKREDGTFDVERFKAAVRIFITAQEILVDNASYPTKEIAENSHIFRTLGLGYANLGSLIMSYGLAYDSDEGRALAGAITAIMTGHAYEQSAPKSPRTSARSRATMTRVAPHVEKPLAKDNVESMLDVIEQHREARRRHPAQPANSTTSRTRPPQVLGQRAGQRHASTATATRRSPCSRPPAPSRFLMDCDTTGIEPDIALVKYKLLAGGGMLEDRQPHACREALAAARLQRQRQREPSSRTSKNSTPSKTSRKTARQMSERPQAGASAGLRLRLQARARQAQHPLSART